MHIKRTLMAETITGKFYLYFNLRVVFEGREKMTCKSYYIFLHFIYINVQAFK